MSNGKEQKYQEKKQQQEVKLEVGRKSMASHEPRENIAIAIDGGGVKGALVVYGLMELEKKLGIPEGKPLISDQRIKAVSGTSTGAIIAAAIALGMTAKEILQLYKDLGDVVFGQAGQFRPFGKTVPLLSSIKWPNGLVKFIDKRIPGGELFVYTMFPARYSLDPFRDAIQDQIAKSISPDKRKMTMKELGEYLVDTHTSEATVIMTATEVSARKTRFIKSYADNSFNYLRVDDAIMASSSIPTVFPAVELKTPKENNSDRWLVDGGVGSFGNPALVAAWEMCSLDNPDERRHHDPTDVTLYSFGTGYNPTNIYLDKYGRPNSWWALQWASRSIDIFTADAIREQSRAIFSSYPGIDLRRFQLTFDRTIMADDWELIDTYLKDQGKILQERIKNNQHAITAPQFDPEGIGHPGMLPYLF